MPSIFVTGAGKGIGRAIAGRFMSAGWDAGGVTRSAEDVEGLIRAGGRFHQGDAGDPGLMCDIAGGYAGGLDLLVNNAGGFAYGGFRDATPDTLEALWRANVMIAFTVTRALLPALTRAGGRIVNIGSVAAVKPLPGKAAYSATKAAQTALFRCLREEIADEGVTVTNVHPGVTLTNSFAGEEVDPATLMDPDDVAEAVYRLATVPGNLVVEELVLQVARGIRL